MSTPYLAEIRLFGFGFNPRGWARCQGQLLPINQNQALFSLLGTTYGGNGIQTFGLPDLRGRTALHFGNGFSQGQVGGETGHTLAAGEMPAHSHLPQASTATASQTAVAGNLWASSPQNPYSAPGATVALAASAIAPVGGSAAHPNEQPYLVLNFSIALQGIFPSRT